MIDILTELLAPLSVVLSLLLLTHRLVLERLGAKCMYLLWLAVPVSLICYLVPTDMFIGTQVVNHQIEHFIINANSTIKQSLAVDWLAVIWFSVSFGFVSFWGINHWQLTRQLHLTPFQLEQKIELPQNLAVYQSAHIFSPMLIGLFKQKLIVPEDFTALYDKEQQRLVLEHEICHFDRNDMYWNLIAFMFVTLFWFHPLVWLAYFRFRRDQELSCDQAVLARKHQTCRINYSKALLQSAQSAPPVAFAQLTFKQYGDKSIMFERIKHIKSNVKSTKLGLALVSALSIGVLSTMSYAGNLSHTKAVAKDIDASIMPIIRIEPKYPKMAVEQQLSGAVLLKFDIDSKGYTQNIAVVKSKPQGVFDQSAMDALVEWRYKAHDHGVITDNYVQLDFVLDSNADKVHLVEAIKVSH